MKLPSPTTVQGAYDYLLTFVILLALLCGLYIVAASAGIAPGL
jgi:hypothetical protein